jgi:hypothetical protein
MTTERRFMAHTHTFVRSLPVFGRGLGIWLEYLFVPSICEEVSPTVEFLKLFSLSLMPWTSKLKLLFLTNLACPVHYLPASLGAHH